MTVAPIAEPLELERRISYLSSILLAAGTAFFFVSFLFAFLYLRALNSNGEWRKSSAHYSLNPSLGLGIGILVCVLAAVAAVYAARRAPARWLPATSAGLGFAAVAVVLQCWQWATLPFGPGDGGYASVYLGWTGFFTLFVLGGIYWLETIVVTGVRTRSAPADVAAELRGFTIFWTVLGLVEVAAFVLLFLVK
jgi:heme/copper-type cytochrome/quinol oxidase subunit 3